MKNPDRLVGYLCIDDSNFAFEFNYADFTLYLYPSIQKENLLNSVFEDIKWFNCKEHKFIDNIKFSGVTSSGKKIIFNVLDGPSSFDGFKVYNVNWYFYYNDSINSDRIDGFRIKGTEIDFFYPPQKALETKIEFSAENNRIKSLQVSSNGNNNSSNCGKYRLIKGVDATIELSAYATVHTDTAINPICANSMMITYFSKPVDIDTLIVAYYNAVRFFEYVTYRSNIDIKSIDIFFYNQDGLKQYDGILAFKNKNDIEKYQNAKNRIISYDVLLKKTTKILSLINKNKIGFGHICKSMDDNSHYPVSRTIMILTEFEREFRNIYGTDFNRSNEYISVKSDIVNLINIYLHEQHGKYLRYAKQLKNYVEDRDNSFEANVRYALEDCEDIMDLFIKRKYHSENYKIAIDGIANRVGELRNGIAHSRLDLKIKPTFFADIKIIEELTYAIRLKKLGIKSRECKKAINDLFGERFGL